MVATLDIADLDDVFEGLVSAGKESDKVTSAEGLRQLVTLISFGGFMRVLCKIVKCTHYISYCEKNIF